MNLRRPAKKIVDFLDGWRNSSNGAPLPGELVRAMEELKLNLYGRSIPLYQEYSEIPGFVEYVDHVGEDLTLVNSARVSFGSHTDEMRPRDRRLIRYLVEHRHTSVLEHCVVTFRFKVPLYVRSQHHRHRTWSYNEISRRYTSFNLEYYGPKKFRAQHESNRQASTKLWKDPYVAIDVTPQHTICKPASMWLREWHGDSLKLYESMLRSGVCREQARGILPQNLYTIYYGTANLNNLIKFIDLRTHEGAQWEIQEMALAVQDICRDLFPIAMAACEEKK